MNFEIDLEPDEAQAYEQCGLLAALFLRYLKTVADARGRLRDDPAKLSAGFRTWLDENGYREKES